MKKILSIFMVAVLSLNLLYQPCTATRDKNGKFCNDGWSVYNSEEEV